MTTAEQDATLASSRDDLHDIASMLHHMQDKLEAFVRDLEDGHGLDNVEEILDFRKGLIQTLMVTGLERADIEDVLKEQRDNLRDAGVEAVPADPCEA
jgi:spore cortex formation protein SpoVR/YcgB (stage V sporulation)